MATQLPRPWDEDPKTNLAWAVTARNAALLASEQALIKAHLDAGGPNSSMSTAIPSGEVENGVTEDMFNWFEVNHRDDIEDYLTNANIPFVWSKYNNVPLLMMGKEALNYYFRVVGTTASRPPQVRMEIEGIEQSGVVMSAAGRDIANMVNTREADSAIPLMMNNVVIVVFGTPDLLAVPPFPQNWELVAHTLITSPTTTTSTLWPSTSTASVTWGNGSGGTYTIGSDMRNSTSVKALCQINKASLDYVKDRKKLPFVGYGCKGEGIQECNPEFFQEQLTVKEALDKEIAEIKCKLRWKQIVLGELMHSIKHCERVTKKNIDKCAEIACGPETAAAKECPENTTNSTCKKKKKTVVKKKKKIKSSSKRKISKSGKSKRSAGPNEMSPYMYSDPYRGTYGW